MDVLSICIPLIISVFAMAYPLAINEIGSINSKYNSERIVEVFRKEFVWKWFNNLLYASLILIAIYVCGKEFGLSLRWMYMLIWTIFISSLCLSVFLILFVKKVFIYKSDILLRNYLIKMDNDSFQRKIEILDLYLYFIRKDKIVSDNKLWEYFSKYFLKRRIENSKIDEGLIFDKDDYQIIWKLHRVVMESNQNELVLLQYNASSGEWLMGRHEYHGRISEDIIKTIWNNLSYAISVNKSYIVIKFYTIVYDYFDQIPDIFPEFDNDDQISNKDEIDQRLDERQDIIDFITVLGGLLYFKNNLRDIGTIFYYTQSQPPDYKSFLPQTICQSLQFYCKLYADDSARYALIDVDYPFPTLIGVGASSKVLGNSFKFIILEYIRLFTIHPYYYEPLIYKGLNGDEITTFNQFKHFFRARLIEFLSDKNLISEIFDAREFRKDPLAYFDEIEDFYSIKVKRS